MSLLYGVWRAKDCQQTIEDCAYFSHAFTDWKCDYEGRSTLGPIAFGSRVFRIYPESKSERQPVHDSQSQTMLVADCRLDNREELANALGLDSVTLRQTPDSELILKAYQRWKKDCFKRLEGDFAIALWDQRKQELLLVRDVMGVRPLAYAIWTEGLAFCSSIPELYRLPSVPPELDEIKMAAQLVNHPTGRERTDFDAIKWVHPGKILSFRDGHESKQTFAEISPISLSKEDQKKPAPQLGELLKESVRKRIRGESDIICELSGGFDSGSITALVSTLLKGSPRKVRAISWAPDPARLPIMDGPDERKQIQWMEERYGISCQYFPVLSKDDKLGEVAFRSSFRRRSKSAIGNARTILSGFGGDEAATFYLRGFHPQLLLLDGFAAATKRLRADFKDSALGYRAPLRLARSLQGLWTASRKRKLYEKQARSITDPQLADQWRDAIAEAHGLEIYQDLLPQSTQDYMIRLLTRGHLELRSAKESLDAAELGVEVAYPMQDPRLLSFVISLHPAHFNYSSRRRRLFRETLSTLELELAPATRKEEEAFASQYYEDPPRPECPDSIFEEIKRLETGFLRGRANAGAVPASKPLFLSQIQSTLLNSIGKQREIQRQRFDKS